jgi:hypothetical protein
MRMSNPLRLLGLAALTTVALGLALNGPAAGADRPRNPMQDLKTLSDMAANDAVQTVLDERHRTLAPLAYTRAETTPFDDPLAACRQPRNQYLMAFGEHMTRHTRRPAGERFEPVDLRTMSMMNSRLRLGITDIAGKLPPPGRTVFLGPDESLAAAPQTWDQALRQRAEWTLVLDSITTDLAGKAHGNLDFGANYAAGLWTRLACDYAHADGAFLKSYADHADAPATEPTRKAIALLRARADLR